MSENEDYENHLKYIVRSNGRKNEKGGRKE